MILLKRLSDQGVYQKYGLMDHGSVWGHGTLRGPEFSAETLHLTGVCMREYYARAAQELIGKESPENQWAGAAATLLPEITTDKISCGIYSMVISGWGQ